MYRKVPKDLTEGSVLGGLVTAISVLALFVLTIAELRSLLQVTTHTEILVDTSDNPKFRINVNLTVFGLSCEYLSVDLKNAMGLFREDLETSTLHRFALDGKGTWKGSAVQKPALQLHNYDIPQGSRDHYGNERHAIELGSKQEFDQALEEHEVLLVDFHSPRCIHCVHFAPTYELAAVKLNSTVQATTRKYGVRLATLDCLQHIDLCRAHHIQAFPTVRVYRSTKQQPPKQEGWFFNRAQEQQSVYEVYRGPREVDSIVAFATRALEEVMRTKQQQDPAAPATAIEDDEHSTVHAAGCRVEGFLDVARVPGSLIIRPHEADESHVYDLNLVNCDHRIDHLSFGPQPPPQQQQGKVFKSAEHGAAHVHFVQVVSRKQVLLSGLPAQDTYEFAMTSDTFKEQDALPHVEIMFEMSPMQIQVSERRTNWVQGITAMMALIGGVFSCSFIIEAILSIVIAWVVT